MALLYLPYLLLRLAGASWADAETVNIEGRGVLDLKPFVCQDITRSSLVNRVCYDAANRTMIVQVNAAYSQYCGVPEAARDSFLNAPSMGQYYRSEISGAGSNGRYDCLPLRVSKSQLRASIRWANSFSSSLQ